MQFKYTIPALAIGVAIAVAAPASAHVTAQPPEQPAGGFTVVNLRVPNESTSPTNKLEVEFPDGITSARTQPVAGWTAKVNMEELDEPIDDGHGGEVTEQVASITFSGGEIQDGEFQEFPISFKMVEEGELGDQVFFPTIQTYADGEEAAWIEVPASADDDAELEKPAPAVTLVASDDAHGAGDDSHGDDSDDDAKSDSDDSGDSAVDEDRVNTAFGLALAALAISLLVFIRSFLGRGKRS